MTKTKTPDLRPLKRGVAERFEIVFMDEDGHVSNYTEESDGVTQEVQFLTRDEADEFVAEVDGDAGLLFVRRTTKRVYRRKATAAVEMPGAGITASA